MANCPCVFHSVTSYFRSLIFLNQSEGIWSERSTNTEQPTRAHGASGLCEVLVCGERTYNLPHTRKGSARASKVRKSSEWYCASNKLV